MRRFFRLFRLLRAERHVIPGRVIFVRVPSDVSRSRVSRSALARGSEVSLPSVERTAVDFSRGSEVRLPSVGCSVVAKGPFPSPGPKVFPCRGSEVLSTSRVHSALKWGFFVGRCVAFAACVGSDLNGLLRSSGFFRRAMRRSFPPVSAQIGTAFYPYAGNLLSDRIPPFPLVSPVVGLRVCPCPWIGSVVTLCLRVCPCPRVGSAVAFGGTHFA